MSGSGQTMFRGFSAGKLTEEGEQGGSEATDWNTYPTPKDRPFTNDYSSPPMVTAEGVPVSSSRSVNTNADTNISDIVGGIGRGLLSIFGPQRQPMYQPVQQPVSAGVPVWVWILVPVGLLGAVALMRKPRRSVAGYRRKSRRSRR